VKEQKGFLPVILLIIVVILAVGGYLLYKQSNQPGLQPQQIKQNSPVAPTISIPSSNPSSTTIPKTTSLNPNTGNLYSDIKVRLNAVLK